MRYLLRRTGRDTFRPKSSTKELAASNVGAAFEGDAVIGGEPGAASGLSQTFFAAWRRGGLARNLLAMVIWQGANYLAPLITFPHLARTLHAAGFGQVGTYILIAGWLTILSDWGTNVSGAREIAQTRAKGGDIGPVFWSLLVLRLGLATVALFGLVIWSIVGHSITILPLLTACWTLVAGNALTVSWCLQGLERLDGFALAALAGRLFTVPATLFLIRRADQAWLAIATQGVGSLLIGCASLVLVARTGLVGRCELKDLDLKSPLRRGWPILISVASHGLYSSTSTLMLNPLQGKVITGQFVCADRLRLAVQGLVGPLSQAMFPRVSRLVVTDRKAAVRLVAKLAVVQAVGMGLLSVFLSLTAPRIVTSIAGNGFSGAIPVLRILSLAVFFYAINNALGYQALIPFGHQRSFGRVTASVAAVNVVVMPFLCKKWGAVGAAWGVATTESLLLVGFLLVLCSRVRAERAQGSKPDLRI